MQEIHGKKLGKTTPIEDLAAQIDEVAAPHTMEHLAAQALHEMPECELEFKSKADMDAWNTWKAKHSFILSAK